MFTGIIETLGTVKDIQVSETNYHYCISANFIDELILGQSIAHNGVCLTVTQLEKDGYYVTAVQETLNKTNLGKVKKGDMINLERCLPANGRFDGHIVQGHVDCVGICKEVLYQDGSWKYVFAYDNPHHITVTKGSICVNGVSLTVVDSAEQSFSVAIIPFTYEHTNFKNIQAGDSVNLEFDIIGKYIQKVLQK